MLAQVQREHPVALLAAGIRRRGAAQQLGDGPATWLEGTVLRHSSMELSSYGDPSGPKSMFLLQLEIIEKFYFFGHTQWRRARKNKRTAHGGKVPGTATLSGAGRRDVCTFRYASAG